MSGTVKAALVTALIAFGCFFLTVGVVGLIRFPNVYNRMHATSKPTTLGTATIFLAGFIYFWPAGTGLASLVGILFLFLTVPTGAHMISRAAERMGVPFEAGVTWPGGPPSGYESKSTAGNDRQGATGSEESEVTTGGDERAGGTGSDG